MAVSLDKVEREAPHLVSLFKSVGVSLEKENIDPSRYPAYLLAEVDHSSSTDSYGLWTPRSADWDDDPTILQVADLGFVAALQFSPLAYPSLPTSLFGGVIHDLGAVDLKSSKGFLSSRHSRYPYCRTTNYRMGLQDIRKRAGYGNIDLHPGWVTLPGLPVQPPAPPKERGFWSKLFGAEEVQPVLVQPAPRRVLAPYSVKATAKVPHLAIFITDGEPLDSKEGIIEELTLMSQLPIFVQFIGVGPGDFTFLEKLDNMEGRFVDNANYFHASEAEGNLTKMIKLMLGEFPDYYRKARQLGLIVP